MLKDKLKRLFKIQGAADIELEAQVFGKKKNNLSIVVGSDEMLRANHVAFVLGYVLIEICADCGLDFEKVMENIFFQMKEKQDDEGLN